MGFFSVFTEPGGHSSGFEHQLLRLRVQHLRRRLHGQMRLGRRMLDKNGKRHQKEKKR